MLGAILFPAVTMVLAYVGCALLAPQAARHGRARRSPKRQQPPIVGHDKDRPRDHGGLHRRGG
jgi:hypothetical protein